MYAEYEQKIRELYDEKGPRYIASNPSLQEQIDSLVDRVKVLEREAYKKETGASLVR